MNQKAFQNIYLLFILLKCKYVMARVINIKMATVIVQKWQQSKRWHESKMYKDGTSQNI